MCEEIASITIRSSLCTVNVGLMLNHLILWFFLSSSSSSCVSSYSNLRNIFLSICEFSSIDCKISWVLNTLDKCAFVCNYQSVNHVLHWHFNVPKLEVYIAYEFLFQFTGLLVLLQITFNLYTQSCDESSYSFNQNHSTL